MNAIVGLIKAVHGLGGIALFKMDKGDIVGHDFRGNQYVQVSSDAESASAMARKTARHSDHEKAAELHRIAADMATVYGPKDKIEHHALSAKKHESEALRLRRS